MNKRYPKNYIRVIGLATLALVLSILVLAPVSAKAAAPEIKLNVRSKTLVTEKSYALKVYNLSDNQTVSFKSNQPECASVDENGLVIANAVGTAVITATVRDDSKIVEQLQCEITVGPPAISIKLTQQTVYLMDGGKTLLDTILLPLNTAENVKFSSLSSEIASVSSGGRITARSQGVTFVVAAIDNGKYDTCKVVVVDEETYLALLENPDADPQQLIPFDIEGTFADALLLLESEEASEEVTVEPETEFTEPAAEPEITVSDLTQNLLSE